MVKLVHQFDENILIVIPIVHVRSKYFYAVFDPVCFDPQLNIVQLSFFIHTTITRTTVDSSCSIQPVKIERYSLSKCCGASLLCYRNTPAIRLYLPGYGTDELHTASKMTATF